MRNIVIFSHEFPPFIWSGIGNTARFLVGSLLVRGFRVKVVTLKFKEFSHCLPFERKGNLEIYRFDVPFYANITMGIWGGIFSWQNKHITKNADLIHAMDTRDAEFVYVPKGVPFLVNANDVVTVEVPLNYFSFPWKSDDKKIRYVYSMISKFIEWTSTRRATYVITNSNDSKKKIKKAYSVPERKMKLVYKGIDISEVPIIKTKDIDMLFVGGQLQLKGVEDVINANYILKRDYGYRNLNCCIIGRGSKKYINKLKKMILYLNIEDNIEYHKSFDHEELLSYFGRSKIFILPSQRDSMPQVLYEAMAAKIPTITSRVGGISELVVENETGFFVDCFNVYGLAAKIDELLKNDKLRNKMGESGHKRVREYFNNRRMVNDYISIYEEFL